MQGGINVPSMPGSLASRNSAMGLAASSGIQQQGGSITGGRFASNNLPASISQVLIQFLFPTPLFIFRLCHSSSSQQNHFFGAYLNFAHIIVVSDLSQWYIRTLGGYK